MGVKIGDTVKINYEGRLENGEIFDTSYHAGHDHPIQFTVGNGEVIKGFEENVIGMEDGAEREFIIQPENAYGERREDLVREFPRDQLPMEKEPEVGMVLGLMTPDGRQVHAVVKEVTPEKIVLDLNHPLAGKRLIFNIQLKEIVDPEEAEAAKEEEKEALENLYKSLQEEAEKNNPEASQNPKENAEETSESPEEEVLEEKIEEVIEEA